MRRLVCVWLTGFASISMAEVPVPEGTFENSACLECHQQQSAELVAAWQQSVHAATETLASCVDCHGKSHGKAAARARRDGTCVDCHGGADSPVNHSYTTSKHGILVRLEQDEWDWNRPLEQANYRAPGCAYCHMHKGNHNVSAGVRIWNAMDGIDTAERERVQGAMRAVCQECHSPRYITRLFDNGERMLDIGRMKVHEAAAVIEQAAGEFTGAELVAAREYFVRMQSLHLKNVYLGIGHQSPDYQWWHGQPALDGDLLRIKGAVGELHRLPARGNSKDGE
ncbi:MAG: multiheme c-type cytochrome [Pseudomonadota bacterium]